MKRIKVESFRWVEHDKGPLIETMNTYEFEIDDVTDGEFAAEVGTTIATDILEGAHAIMIGVDDKK